MVGVFFYVVILKQVVTGKIGGRVKSIVRDSTTNYVKKHPDLFE